MIGVALKMLAGDRGKFLAIVIGIAFSSFLTAYAACYFAGFMSRSYALVAEHAGVDIWVMDAKTVSAEQFANMPESALYRVRSVAGVAAAERMAIGQADVRMPDGRLQPFQVIGVDDATLGGAPMLAGQSARAALRRPSAAIADTGGSEGKLDVSEDPRAASVSAAGAGMRLLRAGDEIAINDRRVLVTAISQTLPRFPPRPLLYMTYSNALRVLPAERLRTSFVVVKAAKGVDVAALTARIASQTGFRVFNAPDFETVTERWLFDTSEDVGDIATMLSISTIVGFGLTSVMLYIFTSEHLRQYAVLKAVGATSGTLRGMVLTQACTCGLLGTGIGLGLSSLTELLVPWLGTPFRMTWYAPVGTLILNLLASVVAALVSLRPVQRLDPVSVFSAV